MYNSVVKPPWRNSVNSVRAKKSLGQHWLRDEVSLAAMCEAGEVTTEDIVLEIGPGTGALTRKLVERAREVIAVEYDHELASALPHVVRAPNLVVVEQNFLTFDLTTLPTGYKVVANIPYYLTSQILRTLCSTTNPARRMSLLVQKEIAERVTAEPGQLSILAISVQFYCEVQLGRVVPRDVFDPPPKVDSQILILLPRSAPLFPDVDVKKFFRLVKAGFSSRRKTLLNSLSGGLGQDKLIIAELLLTSRIRNRVRPQELSLAEWYTVYEVALSLKLL